MVTSEASKPETASLKTAVKATFQLSAPSDCDAAWSIVTAGPLYSHAPMSTTLLITRSHPRWSVVTPSGMRVLLPALIATLSAANAIVCVEPPLSANGSSLGSTPVIVLAEASLSVAPVASSIAQ